MTAASDFLGGDVSGGGDDHIRLRALVIARLGPYPEPFGAVRNGLVHGHVLEMLLFVRNDDVDVVGALKAVIRDAQERVGVRRQIDAADVWTLVHHQIEEARVLVREAVVVLAPDRRGNQQVERGDRRPPGQPAAALQPLGVLIEHRVNHMDERLVGGEEPMASGEQVAFKPAFERVLRKHFHDPAVGRQFAAIGIFGQVIGQPQLLADLINGIQLVRSVFVGPEDTEALHVVAHDVPQKAPQRPRVFGRCLRLAHPP